MEEKRLLEEEITEPKDERILARLLATDLADEALAVHNGAPATTSTLLSTGKLDDEDR